MNPRIDRSLRWTLLMGAVLLFVASLPLSAQDDPVRAATGVTPQTDPASHPDVVSPATDAAAPAPVKGRSAPAPEAQAAVAESAPVAPPDEGWQETLAKVAKIGGAVGLLLSVALGGGWALGKFVPSRFSRRPADKTLRLIESLSMGEKRSIAVVEVAGRRFLVGNTPNEITMLAPLDAELPRESPVAEGADDAVKKASPARPARGRFLKVMLSEPHAARRTSAKPGSLSPDVIGKMRELRKALES
jgi:flagellar biogenesis protein FliO